MTTRQKQCLLVFYGLLEPGDIDGIWGAQSAEATKKLQSQLGLEADGIWGKATDAAVRKAIAEGKALNVSKPDTTGQTGTFWDEIEYFCRDEFGCKCGGKYCNGFPVEPEEAMVRTVDAIRKVLGVPVRISSGIRCTKHNASPQVGGAANSNHLSGKAADLHANVSPAKLKAAAEQVMGSTGGIGLYSWGVHVDTGKYSRWNG